MNHFIAHRCSKMHTLRSEHLFPNPVFPGFKRRSTISHSLIQSHPPIHASCLIPRYQGWCFSIVVNAKGVSGVGERKGREIRAWGGGICGRNRRSIK